MRPIETTSPAFDPFEQVKRKATSHHQGTGLGLAICRKIVQSMNGSISVKSIPDQGATFRIELRDVEVVTGVTGGIGDDGGFNPDQVRVDSAKVLITDDVDSNRSMLASYLSSFDLTLYFAEHGQTAIEQAKIHHPDLILMEMKMPEMDGYKASKQLKSEESTKSIPIVAVAASALAQDEEEIRRHCDGYLRKPISRTALIQEMMRFLKYAEEKETISLLTSNSDMVAPPKSALEVLHELVLDGDMDGITAYLLELESMNGELEEFCILVRHLALRFKDEEINRLLTALLSG